MITSILPRVTNWVSWVWIVNLSISSSQITQTPCAFRWLKLKLASFSYQDVLPIELSIIPYSFRSQRTFKCQVSWLFSLSTCSWERCLSLYCHRIIDLVDRHASNRSKQISFFSRTWSARLFAWIFVISFCSHIVVAISLCVATLSWLLDFICLEQLESFRLIFLLLLLEQVYEVVRLLLKFYYLGLFSIYHVRVFVTGSWAISVDEKLIFDKPLRANFLNGC